MPHITTNPKMPPEASPRALAAFFGGATNLALGHGRAVNGSFHFQVSDNRH
jgi:hypothetical protein